MEKNRRPRLGPRRELLLVEVERRCADAQCNAKARVALTKKDARAYTGFECERCERWNEDSLAERDIPEWWEELAVTGLDGVRPTPAPAAEATGAVIARLSDAWRGRENSGRERPRRSPSASQPDHPEEEDS